MIRLRPLRQSKMKLMIRTLTNARDAVTTAEGMSREQIE